MIVANAIFIEESMLIMYLDAHNLYGWAMTQYLPYSGFKWLSKKEIDEFDQNLVKENSSVDYNLEVDLEYPSELLDLHNDYPLAPKNSRLVKICFQNIVLILLINME